ncbi:acyltransferase family protein [Xenorhabdus bovienii]|nr:acyltransferase [Xenorhabdus bovienii]MDE9457916.1 acyltransferase [Xenorhabdus bovienii]MDE9513982.1 acyltransferase [Xenorhabdus bovienii]
MQERKEINSIQMLRGIAAILVLLFHYRYEPSTEFPNSIYNFFNGSIGVDLFFVISGFIIYHVSKDSPNGLKPAYKFIIKRMVRVLPPYYIITVIFLLFIGNDANKLINSIAFIPSSNNEAPFYGYPLLVVGWSLNYEILFYATICISLFFSGKNRFLIYFLFTSIPLLAFSIYFGNSFLSSSYSYEINSPYLSMMTNSIIFDFFLGIISGMIFHREKIITKSNAIYLLSFSILIFSLAVIGNKYIDTGHGPIMWGLVSFLLVVSLS